MNRAVLSTSMISSLPMLLVACAGTPTGTTIDITQEFADTPEIERLRWFKEINAGPALKSTGLTGKGVRVTVMGDSIDAAHPELSRAVVKQYNAYTQKGKVIAGTDNQPLGAELFKAGDGHGTHIAGTIAAACDGVGIQGLACNARLDAYDLGAYDDADRIPITGWGTVDETERFLAAFSYALNDVAARGESRITTGSFNLESPAIVYSGGSFSGMTITDMAAIAEREFDDIDDLFTGGYAIPENQNDIAFLKEAIERNNEDDPFIALGSALVMSSNWASLEDAIAEYQAQDAVYLITESNYNFDGRTSILNAMPTLSQKVDEDLWLSVVMVEPKDFDPLIASTDMAAFDTLLKGADYKAPLNSCGKMAREYCILTPSWNVLSTMTERTAFDEVDRLILSGRLYQSLEGHSMGAPMVAATLALMEEENLQKAYGFTMKELVAFLKTSANRTFASYDPDLHGVGMLDVGAALSAMSK